MKRPVGQSRARRGPGMGSQGSRQHWAQQSFLPGSAALTPPQALPNPPSMTLLKETSDLSLPRWPKPSCGSPSSSTAHLCLVSGGSPPDLALATLPELRSYRHTPRLLCSTRPGLWAGPLHSLLLPGMLSRPPPFTQVSAQTSPYP